MHRDDAPIGTVIGTLRRSANVHSMHAQYKKSDETSPLSQLLTYIFIKDARVPSTSEAFEC